MLLPVIVVATAFGFFTLGFLAAAVLCAAGRYE